MKSALTYYGGKQKLVSTILPMFPEHTLYAEPFAGGAALFFAKEPSEIEVINDTNAELVNFYKVIQQDYLSLASKIKITMHSRRMYNDAVLMYRNPHLFNSLERAWAVWVLCHQGFAGQIDSSHGYDKAKNTTSKKIINKGKEFTEEFAIRLQNAHIECADALYIIKGRDTKNSFFYCDPPYFNSDCGHYNGYNEQDFEGLLKLLSSIQGKFLLSSYPSAVLDKYVAEHGWHQKRIEQLVSVNKGPRSKIKIECMTANYPI